MDALDPLAHFVTALLLGIAQPRDVTLDGEPWLQQPREGEARPEAA